MVDKEKILAGRKAVEKYRAAHDQLYSKPWHPGIPEEHTPLMEIELAELKKNGFDSGEEFRRANGRANLEVLASSVVRMNYCDGCPGKEKACIDHCQAKAMASRLLPEAELTVLRARRLKRCIEYYPDHYAPHFPLKVGDEFPMAPGCNIILKVVKLPEMDWTWDY